jgi:hypothetical protein
MRREEAADRLGQLHLRRVGAPYEVPARRLRHRAHHGRVRVPQDQRAPGEDVVDVLVAVHVPEPRPARALHEERLAPHRAEGAHRRVDAAG